MVAVAAVVDQADLRVQALQLRVRQAEPNGIEDAAAVGSDRLGELDHGGDAAPASPSQPGVETLRSFGRAGSVDVSEGLLDQVGAVQDTVLGLELLEDLALRGLQLVGVLQQCPPCAFDPGGVPGGMTVAAPGPAAAFVDGLVGELDDVERIDALGSLRCLGASRLGVGTAHVEGDRLQRLATLLAELLVERLQGLGVLALLRPHHGPVPVVVGDDGDVAVLGPVGDLVHPDAVQGLKAGVVDGFCHHPDDDGGHRLPAAAQQLGDRGLVGALGEPGDDVLEVPGVAGPGPCPGHLLGAHPAATPAGQPADLGLPVQPGGSEVEVAPSPPGAVIGGPGREAAGTNEATAPPAQAYHDAVGGEGHGDHAGTAQPQDLVECSGDAHVLLLFSPGAWSLPNIE